MALFEADGGREILSLLAVLLAFVGLAYVTSRYLVKKSKNYLEKAEGDALVTGMMSGSGLQEEFEEFRRLHSEIKGKRKSSAGFAVRWVSIKAVILFSGMLCLYVLSTLSGDMKDYFSAGDYRSGMLYGLLACPVGLASAYLVAKFFNVKISTFFGAKATDEAAGAASTFFDD